MTRSNPAYEANKDPRYLRVFVARHGQTDHNVRKILQGHTDIDINTNGQSQSQSLAQSLSGVPLDAIVSSDLTRCRNTVKPILEAVPAPIRYLSQWRERQMGEVEGMYLQDAIDKFGANFRDLGEGPIAFEKRVSQEWDQICQDHKDSKNILVCTHGGTITMWVNKLYKDRGYKLDDPLSPDQLRVPFNTSVLIIDIDIRNEADSIIRSFGSTQHLGAQFEVLDQRLR